MLLVVASGRIIGQLDRLSIMEALSEIRPEGYALSMKPAEDADALLKQMDAAGLAGLATVTAQYEFNAVWGRAEILQAQGKIPQVKVWRPPAESMQAPQSQAKPTIAVSTPADTPPATITIARKEPVPRETQPAARIETHPVAESIHRDLERGRLAINTLAALDLPLMACDGNGTEIFHNRAYAEIRLREGIHLKSDDLVVRAKDAITEVALKGDLDIDKAVRLKSAPRGYEIFCKAIRNFEDPAARAVGYLFWLTAHTATNPALYAAEAAEGNYAGKTLPDILAAEEAKAMAWAMREANGNQSDAALLLGIPRQTFNYRYRRLTRAKR